MSNPGPSKLNKSRLAGGDNKPEKMELPMHLSYCQWFGCPNKGKKFDRQGMLKVGRFLVCSRQCADNIVGSL